MNPVERVLRSIDRFQQRTPPVAFVFAVVRKFGDDRAGSLAALIAYYGFLSLFPLLLVLITILGLVVTPATQSQVVNSTLSQFPIVGNQLTSPNGIHALRRSSVVGLVVGLIGLLWGALGAAQVAQRAMAEVWNVPNVKRPGFVPRMGRSLAVLAVLGLNVVVMTGATGLASFGNHTLLTSLGIYVLTAILDVGLYLLAFRLLTPPTVRTRAMIPGAVLAGIAWAALQHLGGYLVAHQLKNSSQVYGYFASVLGLIGFLYLASEVTLYATEVSVVWERRLWPRSLLQPPLTDADVRMLTYLAEQEERRPEQRVLVHYRQPDEDQPPAPSEA